MAFCSGWSCATPAGDAASTLRALAEGRAHPGPLQEDLLELLLRLSRSALAGARPDRVLLATTKGDLPAWCAALLATPPGDAGGPTDLARRLGQAFHCPAEALGAACAGGPIALAQAARLIATGAAGTVLVLGGDRQGPFITAGFQGLGAIDPRGCRPFADDRAGLALGETAAAVVLRAAPAPLALLGWGQTLDAHHRTGPARDGAGLGRACRRAATAPPALLVAHGTGTVANDGAEATAYAREFPGVPVTAWKDGLGHSLGASGLTEAVLVLEGLATGRGLPGCAAATAGTSLLPRGWHPVAGPVLSANAGFGGFNGAVLLGPGHPATPPPVRLRRTRRITVHATGWQDDAGASGSWDAVPGHLPRPTARQVLGRVDVGWGHLDGAARLLCALGQLLGPWPTEGGILLATDDGCRESDLRFERSRLAGTPDLQAFPATLASAPVGEAAIRLGLRGPGLVVQGADDLALDRHRDALAMDHPPALLMARIDTGGAEERAWAERWDALPDPAVT